MEGVDESMGHGLCSGAELEYRKNFRARIDGQPQPEHLRGTAEPGAQFIQLQREWRRDDRRGNQLESEA